MNPSHLELAVTISQAFVKLKPVEAVALGGSYGSHSAGNDAASDIDIYVYTRADVPLEDRRKIVEITGGATIANIGLNYWGAGDEWYHQPTGIEVDIVYFDAAWMEDQIDRVIRHAQPSMGYSTCFWHTLRQSLILSDRQDWLRSLQMQCNVEYPEELRLAIIAINYPVLRQIIPAYAHQVEKAVWREDLVSVNHRLAAFFASYFDILFAFNRVLHPGEKRMVAYALSHCSRIPEQMEVEINEILQVSRQSLPTLPAMLNRLLDHLDEMLKADGLI